MQIKPIQTESDYDVALAEVGALLDATPNTPTADKLEIPTALVESYGTLHHPVPPPDPIDALHYSIESRRLAALA